MSPTPLPSRTPPAPEHPAPAGIGARGPATSGNDSTRCAATPGPSLRCRLRRFAARTGAAVGAAHRAGVPF